MPSNAMSPSTISSNAASLLARLCVALLFIPSGFAKIGGFTGLFHNFWGVPVEQLMAQKQMFFKNVAILAGLLMLTAFGPGRWSLEGWRFSGLRTGLARCC